MKCNSFLKIIPMLAFVVIFPAVADCSEAAGSVFQELKINPEVSVSVREGEGSISVRLAGNGKKYKCSAKKLVSPHRVMVDIFGNSSPFRTRTIVPKKKSEISSIRVGYHQKNIRIVLDIEGEKTPFYTLRSKRDGVCIDIKSESQAPVNSKGCRAEPGRQMTERAHQEGRSVAASGEKARRKAHEKGPAWLEENDGKDDTTCFLEGINAFKAKDMETAIERFGRLIKSYPSGRYMERAYFLLAQSYDRKYADSIQVHFREIADHYEEAISNFPDSIYVPGAVAGIGDLCFRMKYHTEALGYYNLVLKKYRDSRVSLRAMMQKARILRLKGKNREALSAFEKVVSADTDIQRKTEAELEVAKILHEMNAFHRSLKGLFRLRQRDPQNIYLYPEITLYTGYNYQQLGDSGRARQNLLWFYNIFEGRLDNHLILTKIGDTYRDEGLIEEAEKIYRLVLRICPETEGARISAIRLADQVQKGALNDAAPLFPDNGTDAVEPWKIYEDIIADSHEGGAKDPLRQLALVKLALLHEKEKRYLESINTLKRLFKEYPGTSLEKEAEYTLRKAVESLFAQEMKEERYTGIINFCEREKKLLSIIDSPITFITAARACVHLNLDKMAAEMFARASPLLRENEKPADLIFHLARDLYESGRPEQALVELDLLVSYHSSDKYSGKAYRLKGDILLNEARYAQAAEAFSAALGYPSSRCEKSVILAERARALSECGFGKEALESVREADMLKGACSSRHDNLYQEIGEIYLNLGHAEEAAVIFNQAIEIEKENLGRIPSKFKLAQCYRLLDRTDDSMALYEQIAGCNDPFWSNLAKEKIEEVNFDVEFLKTAAH